MTNQPLNPDALEAGAKAIFDVRDDEFDLDEWEDLDSTERERYKCDARACIPAYLTVAQPEVTSANFPNVTRVEVIRDGGRALTVYGTEDVFYDIQDEGRTLKVFMKAPSPDYSAYRKAPYPERNRPEVKP